MEIENARPYFFGDIGECRVKANMAANDVAFSGVETDLNLEKLN